MPTAKAVMIADVALLLDTTIFADTVTIEGSSVSAVITLDEQIDTVGQADGRGCPRTGVLFLSTDTTVVEGDTVVLPGSSNEWRVVGMPAKDTRGGQRVAIMRYEMTEKSARNYRIERA